MRERIKFYPEHDQLILLGFVHMHSGDGEDPRDWWYEIDLSNFEWNKQLTIKLELDAYFDFNLVINELEEGIPLNFQSIDEIQNLISIFKRPCNQTFSGLFDLLTEQSQQTHKYSI